MRLIINGRSQELPSVKTLQEAAKACKVTNAIALLNDCVVPTSQWTKTVLKEDDHLELVAIVGGG